MSMHRRALMAAVAVTFSISHPAMADRTITVSTDSLGTWEGWGTSLAWWGKGVGRSGHEDTYADLLYTLKPVRFYGRVLPGLGLNIVRYNIGGGGWPTDNVQGRVDAAPPAPAYPPDSGDPEKQHQLPWFRDIDGYWVDWFSYDPRSTSWDWQRDANQRSMLRAIHRRGAQVEFFSNAPMWWMTRNDPDDQSLPSNRNLPRRSDGTPYAQGCRKSAVDNACKSSAGGTLQRWNYGDYAYYLASVVERARKSWGIHVSSVAPFNEPMASDHYAADGAGQKDWFWRYPARQEGVHLDVSEQATILRALRSELDTRGLNDVRIAASDENNAPHAKDTYEQLVKAGVDGLIDRVNVHSYGYPDTRVSPLAPPHTHKHVANQQLRAAIGTKNAWVSEYGNCEDPMAPCSANQPHDESTNGSLATAILTDLDHLKPSAWLYWQAVEYGDADSGAVDGYTSKWGLVNGAFGRETDQTSSTRARPSYINNKYFVFAQFTRFLRPGFERLQSRQSAPPFDPINRSVAAYDKTGKKLVLIWDNRGAAQSITFDLSALGAVSCRVASVTATRHDGTLQFNVSTTLVTARKLAINAEVDTIYSIVVPGVTMLSKGHAGNAQMDKPAGGDHAGRCSFDLDTPNHPASPKHPGRGR